MTKYNEMTKFNHKFFNHELSNEENFVNQLSADERYEYLELQLAYYESRHREVSFEYDLNDFKFDRNYPEEDDISLEETMIEQINAYSDIVERLEEKIDSILQQMQVIALKESANDNVIEFKRLKK
tara:strand:- start:627 stop:1004 length:378 start_codon:yes stop_codon:yes gene_type:complete